MQDLVVVHVQDNKDLQVMDLKCGTGKGPLADGAGFLVPSSPPCKIRINIAHWD